MRPGKDYSGLTGRETFFAGELLWLPSVQLTPRKGLNIFYSSSKLKNKVKVRKTLGEKLKIVQICKTWITSFGNEMKYLMSFVLIHLHPLMVLSSRMVKWCGVTLLSCQNNIDHCMLLYTFTNQSKDQFTWMDGYMYNIQGEFFHWSHPEKF